MDNLGFFRVAAAIPEVHLADPFSNIKNIITLAREARQKGATLVVFPELSVTGYTCADLFNQQTLLDATIEVLEMLADESAEMELAMIVGAPLAHRNHLFNCAVVIQN